MYPVPALATPHLVLRGYTAADAPALLALLGDREVNTFLPMFPLDTLAQAQAYLEALSARDGWFFAVCPGDGPLAGYVHIQDTPSRDTGWALARSQWGKGYATEAARAAIGYVKTRGVPFVTATHDVNNPRSGAVMRRLGMRYCYSYREQWQPKDLSVVFRLYQLDLDGPHPDYDAYRRQYPAFTETF